MGGTPTSQFIPLPEPQAQNFIPLPEPTGQTAGKPPIPSGWWAQQKAAIDDLRQGGAKAAAAIDAAMKAPTPAEQIASDVGKGQYAKAIHTGVTAGGQSLLPLLPASLAEAPLSVAASLLFGALASKGAQAGARALGATPDQANVAGDVAGLVGGLGGYKAASASGPALSAIAGRSIAPAEASAIKPAAEFQPALRNTPEEVLDYAQKRGINLTPAEATQKPVAQTIQAVGERSLLGADALADARNANRGMLIKSVKDLADQMDPHKLGASEQSAGETIQQNASVGQNVAHENASNAYKELPNELLERPVDTSSLRSKYFQILKESQTSLANRNPQIASQIQSILDQGSNLGIPAETEAGTPYRKPEMSFQDLMKVRSDALQDGKAMSRAGAPSKVEAMYQGLASDVDSLMQAAAKKAGYLKEWRDANGGWEYYKTNYADQQSPLYRILNQADPVRVTRDILTRSSVSDIQALKGEQMTGAIEALRRQAIIDIANRNFTVRGDGLGGYPHEFLEELFGKGPTKELYLQADLARRMNFQVNPSGTSNVLLGDYQLSPEPSRWGIPLGAAKASMPKPAQAYLPRAAKVRVIGALPAMTTMSTLSAMLGDKNQ